MKLQGSCSMHCNCKATVIAKSYKTWVCLERWHSMTWHLQSQQDGRHYLHRISQLVPAMARHTHIQGMHCHAWNAATVPLLPHIKVDLARLEMHCSACCQSLNP